MGCAPSCARVHAVNDDVDGAAPKQPEVAERTASNQQGVVGPKQPQAAQQTEPLRHKLGALCGGNDIIVKECTLEEAKADAMSTVGCVGFTFNSREPTFEGKKMIYFKSSLDGNDDSEWQMYLVDPALVCKPSVVHKVGALGGGNDLLVRPCTLAAAKELALATEGCHGFTFQGDQPTFNGERTCYFKGAAGGNDDAAWQTYLVRPPPLASAPPPDDGKPPPDVAEYIERRLVLDMNTCTVIEEGEEEAEATGGGAGEGTDKATLPLPIGCYPCVDDAALRTAAHVAARMLTGTPLQMRKRMVDSGASLGVIGKAQRTSDIPAHRFLRGQRTFDGRTFDSGCRGVGGVPGCPCTSVGEENLLMLEDDSFSNESIMVHEFAHACMNLGLSDAEREEVRRLYDGATSKEGEEGYLGEKGSNYMLSNADEFWAEATQAWFAASARTDVNCSLRTRADVRTRTPAIAALLERVYGDGEWRYLDTCPRAWASHPDARTDS